MKMKLIKTFLLIFFLVIGYMKIYSQELAIGIVTSMDYDYRMLKDQKLRDDYEKGLINFRYGFDLDKEFNTRLGIKTGIRYIKIGYKTNDEDLVWGSEHDGEGGYEPDPILPYSGTIKHVYKYLEIPLHLKYIIIDKEFKVYTEIGGSLNYGLNEKWKDKYEFNRLNISTSIGFGIKSNINNRISIFGMPIFRYHFTKTLKKTVVENLYSAGIEIGFKVKIK